MAEFPTCFQDHVFVITGAGGILGGATAIRLAKCGGALVLIDNNSDRLDGIVAKCKSVFPAEQKILALVADACDKDQVASSIQRTIEKFGKINAIINIVSGRRLGSLEDVCLEDLDEALNGCIRSTFLMSKLALPHLVVTKGCVVNMSSISGVRPFHSWLPTGTAKAAVNHMTRIMAAGVAKHGVRVNAVAPSLVRDNDPNRITPAIEKAYAHGGAAVPLGRVGTGGSLFRECTNWGGPSGEGRLGKRSPGPIYRHARLSELN